MPAPTSASAQSRTGPAFAPRSRGPVQANVRNQCSREVFLPSENSSCTSNVNVLLCCGPSPGRTGREKSNVTGPHTGLKEAREEKDVAAEAHAALGHESKLGSVWEPAAR